MNDRIEQAVRDNHEKQANVVFVCLKHDRNSVYQRATNVSALHERHGKKVLVKLIPVRLKPYEFRIGTAYFRIVDGDETVQSHEIKVYV